MRNPWIKFLVDYGLFAIIIVAALAIFPSYLTPILGATLGQWTSYVITGLLAMGALWVHRKVRKKVD